MVDMPFPSGLHFPTWSSMSAHISPEQSALGDAHSLSDVDAPAAAGAVLGVLPEVAGPQSAQSVPRGQTWDAAPERPSSHSPSFENEHALEHAWPETIATCKSTSARIIIFRAFLDESCGGDHRLVITFGQTEMDRVVRYGCVVGKSRAEGRAQGNVTNAVRSNPPLT